jgi:HPt (histidine-containing phosphotransfer) domain-containing protein
LFSAIDQLLASTRLSDAPGAMGQALEAAEKVDRALLLATFGGKVLLLAEVVGVFLADVPTTLGRLRTAAAAGDTQGVFAAAHQLKGAVGLFSQGEAFRSAQRLEQLAGAGDVPSIQAACADLEGAVARLEGELRDLIQKS